MHFSLATLLFSFATLGASHTLNVDVIYTGGTIGMVYDPSGQLVPGPPKLFQQNIKDIAKNALNARQKQTLDISIRIAETEPLLDSCNIG